MFQLTAFGWLIFRSRSAQQIADLAGRLVLHFDPSIAVLSRRGLPLLFYTLPLLAIHAIEARRDDLMVVPRWPTGARYAVYAALVYFIVLFGDFAGAQFIYFQF